MRRSVHEQIVWQRGCGRADVDVRIEVAAIALTVCHRVRISESYWLRSRPRPAADSAASAGALPGGYAPQPFHGEVRRM